MRILSWVQTDVGQKRDHNEDSYLAAPEIGLYVVADGMGGHAGGDQASSIAVTLLIEGVEKAGLPAQRSAGAPGEEPPALRVLREASRNAGEVIFDMAQQNPHLAGMGTTLSALLFHGGRVHLAHVGDSRAYLFRDGRIEQLTEDHSWINEQVKAGLITDEEARHSKFKHIITRSVGFERDVAVDVMSLPVLMGDCYLMCSDGLSNYMENDELGQMLTSTYYGRIPQQLVGIANERGGDDNITVVLVYVANDSGPPQCIDMTLPGSAADPSRNDVNGAAHQKNGD
jgi:serine/threonine protein phosphatase PrpC